MKEVLEAETICLTLRLVMTMNGGGILGVTEARNVHRMRSIASLQLGISLTQISRGSQPPVQITSQVQDLMPNGVSRLPSFLLEICLLCEKPQPFLLPCCPLLLTVQNL
jgi:hypothetical protein